MRISGVGEQLRPDRGRTGSRPVHAAGLGAGATRANGPGRRPCSSRATGQIRTRNHQLELRTLPTGGRAGTDLFQSLHERKRVRVRADQIRGGAVGEARRGFSAFMQSPSEKMVCPSRWVRANQSVQMVEMLNLLELFWALHPVYDNKEHNRDYRERSVVNGAVNEQLLQF